MCPRAQRLPASLVRSSSDLEKGEESVADSAHSGEGSQMWEMPALVSGGFRGLQEEPLGSLGSRMEGEQQSHWPIKEKGGSKKRAEGL